METASAFCRVHHSAQDVLAEHVLPLAVLRSETPKTKDVQRKDETKMPNSLPTQGLS